MSSKRTIIVFLLCALLAFLPGCLFHRHRHTDLATPVHPGDQPDKILYEKAYAEIDRGRYDVGRLTLQTLINTYPDSEYLAKAKLAIADSYYNEGGVSGLTQAEAEYKDFITFFPTAPEAPEAQFRVGMAHFRLMAKADRDETEAKLAEAEFKDFLLKYPDSPLVRRVKARLREVQEVLAQGEFKIAKFYYMRQANRAAESRFEEIAEHYPDFSRGDSVLWYLGQTLERLRTPQAAVPFYARIITDFPLSPLVGDSKAQLAAMHQPIPRPTKAMLARARADQAQRVRRDPFEKMGALMSSGPDISATRHGPVRLGARKPAQVEIAKTSPTNAAPGNSIVVKPVSDASLNAGDAADAKPTSTTSEADSGKPAEAQEASTAPNGTNNSNPPDVPVPAKKKGRMHIFKKMIKPF
jgi:outer membrane protein assembly factor BamD